MNKKKTPIAYTFYKKQVFRNVIECLRISAQSSGKKFDISPAFSTEANNSLVIKGLFLF